MCSVPTPERREVLMNQSGLDVPVLDPENLTHGPFRVHGHPDLEDGFVIPALERVDRRGKNEVDLRAARLGRHGLDPVFPHLFHHLILQYWLPHQDSNLKFPDSESGVLPVTPCGNMKLGDPYGSRTRSSTVTR